MDRKRGVEYIEEWNGFDASEYLPRQIVPDFDRAVYNADQLTDRDMRLYLKWDDDTLGTFQMRYGKTKPSPTHPSKQPALLTGYMKRQQKQKASGVTQASSSSASGSRHTLQNELENSAWTGRELWNHDFVLAGNTYVMAKDEQLRSIIFQAGGRILDDLDLDAILVCGGSNSDKFEKQAQEMGAIVVDQKSSRETLLQRNSDALEALEAGDFYDSPLRLGGRIAVPSKLWVTMPANQTGQEAKRLELMRRMDPEIMAEIDRSWRLWARIIQVNLDKKTPGHGQHRLILTSTTTRRVVLWMQRHHSRLTFGLFGRGGL